VVKLRQQQQRLKEHTSKSNYFFPCVFRSICGFAINKTASVLFVLKQKSNFGKVSQMSTEEEKFSSK
jgi:hypothetical protein